MIEEVRKIVKKECNLFDWKYHIVPVVKYAKLLAKKLGANEEIAEIAALLHDIGRIKFGSRNHEITGIQEAEKILKKLNAPKEVIEEVKHCIESHRSKGKPKTILAKIIANADAMAHLDAFPLLIAVGLEKENGNIEKAVEWVHEKVERDWNKKLTIPEAKEMVKEKYEAINLLLNAMEKYA